MRHIPDILIFLGLALVTAGVYLEYGLGYALMVAGGYATGVAFYLAGLVNNVSDD
jgi:hypothetical protein